MPIVGAVLYYLLAKYWWFKKYPQQEIVDPDDSKYLGITVGNSWSIDLNDEAASVSDASQNTTTDVK